MERIVVPGREAQELVMASPYVTRLLTVLDANEMTFDPMFHERADLPDVGNTANAIWDLPCEDSFGGFFLPDGLGVALTESSNWPEFDTDMPYASTVEQIPVAGDPEVLVDNSEAIAEWLTKWNEDQGWPPDPDAESEDQAAASGATEDPLIFGDDPEFVDDSAAAENADGPSFVDSETTDAGPGPAHAEGGSRRVGSGEVEEAEARRSGGCAFSGTRSASYWWLGLALMVFGRVRRRAVDFRLRR
jgi:hypothetical protein